MNYNLKLQAYKISQIAVDTKLIKDGRRIGNRVLCFTQIPIEWG